MRNYTFKQVLTFIEVAREKSVSKAAERLFVTQPAVSMQIRQLEDAFGLPLIEPLGRNIQLTGAGQEFLVHAIAAVGHFKDLEATMAEHAGLKKGHIELAVVSTAKYFVPMLLVQFAKLLPGIDVSLRIDNRENILGMLSRNEVDLVMMGRAPKELDCEATSFATNPQAILCAPGHPLSRRKRVQFDQLADCPFVVREPGSGTRAAMERLFAQHDVPVRHELAAGHLALVDVIGLPIVGHWYVTHLRQRKLAPAARAFKAFLIEQGGPLVDSWA